MKKISFNSFKYFRQAVRAANLALKIGRPHEYGILNALLSTIRPEGTLSVSCDYFAVFDGMTDMIVSSIFE